MKNFMQWPARAGVVGSLALAALLSACGGGGSSSDSASVRVVNATLTHPSVDLFVSSASALAGTSADAVSAYVGVATGGSTLQINDAGVAASLISSSPTLTKDQHYALVAYESGGAVRMALLNEDATLPAAGSAYLRVYDTAADAGLVDVYVTDPATDLAAVASPNFTISADNFPTSSALVAFSPGTYRVRVTASGNKSDVRLDIPSAVLASQQVGTVILTPTTGGLLLNGSLLIQQGAYTASRNTTARVRVAAAVANSARVSATVGGTIVDGGSGSGTLSPAFGAYVSVPANGALSVGVNDVAQAAPTGTLKAGGDYTLLVYGNPGSTTASIITDDNRLPVGLANAKMRLINGVTGTVSPLTMSASFVPVAANVQPGTASTYSVVSGSTSMQLDVTSALSLTALYSGSALNIPGSAVYTMFMVGDSSAPVHQFRRDR